MRERYIGMEANGARFRLSSDLNADNIRQLRESYPAGYWITEDGRCEPVTPRRPPQHSRRPHWWHQVTRRIGLKTLAALVAAVLLAALLVAWFWADASSAAEPVRHPAGMETARKAAAERADIARHSRDRSTTTGRMP